MALTTDEVWSFNGTPLNQPYWNISTFGGSRYSLPLLRGQNIEVPFTAGQEWRYKLPDSRTVTLVMWAAGVDQVTLFPAADQRKAFNNNFQQLRQLFWQANLSGSVQCPLQRTWFLTQSGIDQLVTGTAQAEIAGSMEPTMTGRTRADFSVDLLLADPYFYGTLQTQTLAYNSAATVINLGEGVVGSGLSCTFTAQLNGPLTNPTLTNSTAGVSVTYNATIPGGQFLTLDIVNFTAVDSNGVNQIGSVTHAGARMWMGLLGAGVGTGRNTLKLTSTNGSDTGNCVLQWTPPYI